MSLSINEVQSFTAKAARGAGFPVAQSTMFGQAAVWHVALAGEIAALDRALDDPKDSPILRLPLLLEDIRRARDLAGPQIELSVQADDTALIPAYLRLLPGAASAVQITARPEAPPLLSLQLPDPPPAADDLPARLSLPAPFLTRLQRLGARRLVPASEASRKGAGA